MNELKPEDVMRALECCTMGVNWCKECPIGEGERCVTHLAEAALALLREKDARIKELEDAQGAEFTCFVGEPHKVDRCPYGDELVKKDSLIEDYRQELGRARVALNDANAEIERLTINMNAYGLTAKNLAKDFEDYRADVKMEIADARAEAIDEFVRRIKAHFDTYSEDEEAHALYVRSLVDQIAKEMKGDQDA